MAVTRIWPVRGQLSHPIDYAANPDKTKNEGYNSEELQTLKDVMNYAVNEEKTEKEYFVSGVNCNPAIARQQYINVKKQFYKEGGIICYHAYQSFAEGEVTPQQAHDIGLAFAKRLWGEDYQVVVATHLNTKCLHNHFVVNSVSFLHGRRCRKKQWNQLSNLSDEICRQFHVSVIENPKGRSMPIELARAEREGKPSRLNIARQAVDEAIVRCHSIKELEAILKQMGYICQFKESRKYWTIQQKDWDRPLRLIRMGEAYSNEGIKDRIRDKPANAKVVIIPEPFNFGSAKRNYHLPTREDKIKKVGGLKGLYLHYCYLLGYLPRYNQNPKRVHYLLRDDLLKLEHITKEVRLLSQHNINTDVQLTEHREAVEQKIKLLLRQRAHLRNLIRRKACPDKAKIKTQIAGIGRELAALRGEARLCENIEKRSAVMKEKIHVVLEEREKVVRNQVVR